MIEYNQDISMLKASDLDPFFEGWNTKPELNKRLDILKNSEHVIIALEGTKLIGFVTAITDKTLSAYIPLLEVIPEFRKSGIGSELITKMLEKLKSYYMIDLCCDSSLASFYEKLGFAEVSGMIIRKYHNI